MSEMEKLKKQLEQALAYVHASVDGRSPLDVAQARRHAERLLPRAAAMKPLRLTEARQLYEYVSQLRALLRVLDGQMEART
jgi:hypothetical protein